MEETLSVHIKQMNKSTNVKYKVCIVSSSRADFGLLQPLLTRVENEENLELCFIVTGSHLSKSHGYSVNEVERSNIPISLKIDIKPDNYNAIGIGETIGRTTKKFSKAFFGIKPNLLVILGDRYEILGVVMAAHCMRIPIAHIHGGEVTYGAIDDSIRHAITKFSNLHFVCSEDYRNRVIQMGEHPNTVFNTGALALKTSKISRC